MSSYNDQISIGRFSQITRLSSRALRLYDEKGLLIPARKDFITGYRYYSIAQINTGLKIKQLVWLGFGLKEIQLLLEKDASIEENQMSIQKIFDNKLREISAEIDRLKKIENILLGKSNLDVLYMKISDPIIKNAPSLRVLSIRQKGNIGELIPQMLMQAMGLIYNPKNDPALVKVSGPPMYLCHDESFKPENADIEIAVPVTGNLYIEEPFTLRTIPEQKIVSVLHTGPYHEVSDAYTKVFNYIAKESFKPAGPSRELYLNSPDEVKEEELLTEIQVPIE